MKRRSNLFGEIASLTSFARNDKMKVERFVKVVSMSTIISVLAWPFKLLWKLVTFILSFTGRIIAVVLGFVLMILGGFLTASVVAAPVGIPLIIVGFLLVLRGIF
ncbi:MAG: hypothetical protein JXB48_07255 [Candidatus Latescibacteria bacterium]|nr:hypothetical protein [Candidatus Latescibacterota bacterium]